MLYGLHTLKGDLKALYESGYFSMNVSGSMIEEAIMLLLEKIRPQALNILESTKFPDEILMSAVGNSYGDIYETHFEWAKNSQLNQGEDSIPKGYFEDI